MCVNSASTVLRGAGPTKIITGQRETVGETRLQRRRETYDYKGETGLLDPVIGVWLDPVLSVIPMSYGQQMGHP